MKKVLLVLVLFICFSAINVSAWEPNDLTKFPPCMNEKNWILNLGFGLVWLGDIGNDHFYIPSFRLSFDKNAGLGDKKLPFFFGGIVGYSGEGHKRDGWFQHNISLGFRAGYHFNWGVDKLDTYAVTTIGWVFHNWKGNYSSSSSSDSFWGINIGARWFVSDNFGFWAETGYLDGFNIDLGLAFKF